MIGRDRERQRRYRGSETGEEAKRKKKGREQRVGGRGENRKGRECTVDETASQETDLKKKPRG
jgi:hypothetical protein